MLDDGKPTTAGELKLSDLPPIENLTITVPINSLIKIDTILFMHDGKPIGHIFDVFGPITEPHYSIRFTNGDQIKEKDIHKDMPVYFVPEKDRKLTKFAFVNELRKKKGTDASWENDNEPPETAVDENSDDDSIY